MKDPRHSSLDVPADVLRRVLDSHDEPFFVFGTEGRLRSWNRALCERTGYANATLDSMTTAELFGDSDIDRFVDGVEVALDGGRATVEAALVTADGDRVPHEITLVDLSTTADEEFAVGGLARPLPDRGAGRWSGDEPPDRMTDAFFAVDEDWRLTYVNEQARPVLAAAMGRDPDGADLEGRHLWESISDAVGTTFYEEYHEAMATQDPATFVEYYEPLDAWLEVRAFPSETGLSVYFRDVTERRRRRETLKERERVLRDVYRVTSDTDRSFTEKVEALFDIGCETLGTDYATLSQIRGDDYVFEVVKSPDGTVEAGDTVPLSATNCERTAADEETLVLANVARDAPELTDKSGYAEWGIARYLGAPVVVSGSVRGTFCFYDEDPREEEFTQWEVTLVDLLSQWVSYELTRQRANERLQRQNDHLERFASVVSHDLRNPLSVLRSSLELADQQGEHVDFERCFRTLDRMEALVEDLLSLARAGQEPVDVEPLSVSTLARECWATVETGDATLTVETDATVRANASRFRQLLANLFRNAVEHGSTSPPSQAQEDSVEHGSTGSRTESDDAVEHGRQDETAPTVTVGTLSDGFYVADDGPGIPQDDRKTVFDTGYTTAESGTGFGLAIVREVADAHGWTVGVTEAENGGARFEFSGVEFV